MEKYYTPDIEELIPNVEVYLKSGDDQVTSRISNYFIRAEEPGIHIAIDLESVYRSAIKNYKIKFLDKDDIEDLGFILKEDIPSDSNGFLYEFRGANYKLRYNGFGDMIIYSTLYYKLDSSVHYVENSLPIFIGKIKNKSELKKLLKQLCITNGK